MDGPTLSVGGSAFALDNNTIKEKIFVSLIGGQGESSDNANLVTQEVVVVVMVVVVL